MFKNKIFAFLVLFSLLFFLLGCTDFDLEGMVECHDGMICSEVDVMRCPEYCSMESEEQLKVNIGVVNAETLDFISKEKDIVVSLIVCGQGFCSEENLIDLSENPGVITTSYPDWENIDNFRVIINASVDDFESEQKEFSELEKEMEIIFYLEPLENDDDFDDGADDGADDGVDDGVDDGADDGVDDGADDGADSDIEGDSEEELDDELGSDGVEDDGVEDDGVEDDDLEEGIVDSVDGDSSSESNADLGGTNQPISEGQDDREGEQEEIEAIGGVGVASGLENDSAELGLFEVVEENAFVIAIIFIIVIVLIVVGVVVYTKKGKKPKDDFGEKSVEASSDSFDNNYFNN
jgi:hypothetical protein